MDNLDSDPAAQLALLRGMLAASPDCVKLLTREGVVRYINERGVALNEFDCAADVVGKSFPSLWPESERGRIAEAIAGASAGAVTRVEAFGPTARGAARWWDASFAPFQPADGSEALIVGVSRDITARVEAERALLQGGERDRTWLLSPDLMCVHGMDGVFESCNPAWHATLGWTSTEVEGVHFTTFLHPEDVEPSKAAMAEIVRTGEPALRFENRYRRKDGGWSWLSWVSVPHQDGKVYCVARDVTQARERAEALSQAEEALRQAQKMEAVGQLTGGLAHDFNNLLAGITGSLELVRRRAAEGRLSDVERYVGAGLGAAKRAAALTHRLLAFSRRQTLEPKPLDVNRLVQGMEDLVRRTVGPAIEVESVSAAGLWTIEADASQLENSLLNLCINARDAMPEGGKLTIETANRRVDERTALGRDISPGQYVSMCVSDNGVGMAPEVVARAFDPFFTTKPLGLGTGLGLSMIYGFARQSGGHARIYSEPGEGTMVCVYLPRFNGRAQASEEAGEAGAAPRAEQGQTVLVLDDEPTVRMFVAEVMGELGYATLEAGDGAEALKILESDRRVDLLISDVGLPGGMNGRQVADAARVARPGLKVLFITGYAENAVLSHGHLEPGMHVMTKPFELDALARRAKELIESI